MSENNDKSENNKEKMEDIFRLLDSLAYESIDSLDVVMENQGILLEAWKRVGEVINDLVDKVANIEDAFKSMAGTLGCDGCGSTEEKKKDVSTEIYV